jgi:ADP-L-glycero-D-manno-heptose 6-epimerase
MKSAIITGTKGFIGGNLKKRLQNDYQIIEINEDIFDNPDWKEELESIIIKSEASVFFHIGACANTLESDVNYMMIRNFESTKIISDVCRDKNIPLIFSSSAAVYGDYSGSPANIYAWSKLAAESYVIKNWGVALRYFNVYGPGEENKGKMASVAYQMWVKNKSGEKITLFPLKPSRDFVYVDDVVDANLHAYINYSSISGWFDVGSGDSRTFEDILDIMDIDYEYASESDIPKGYQFYTKSQSKKWMDGWVPDYNLERGLNEYKNYLI